MHSHSATSARRRHPCLPRASLSYPQRFGGPGQPRVIRSQIRGEWWITKDLIWPALAWNRGHYWAYLHDLTPETLRWVMVHLREAELDRKPAGILRWGA